MSLRRLLLFIVLFGMFIAGLSSGFIAQARTAAISNRPAGPRIVGEWLLLRKLPDTIYVERGSKARFSIGVLNTSDQFEMRDVVVSDPLSPACDRSIGSLSPKGDYSYTCFYENVQVPFTNEAFVHGINTTNDQEDSASDTARVEVLELTTGVAVEPDAVTAPGGPVKFTVAITNLSSVSVPLTLLNSPQFGDLADPQNEKVSDNSCASAAGLPPLAKNGGSFDCFFTFGVGGLPGDQIFVVTAEGEISDGPIVSGSGTAVVKVVEIIAASLASESDRVVAGGSIKLTTTIQNMDESISVTILALEDAVLGDVRPYGDCLLPQMLAPGDAYSCSYEQIVTGTPGEEQSYILDVSAETGTQPPIALSDQASATVTVYAPTVHLPVLMVIPRPISCAAPLLLKTDTSYLFYPDTTHAIYWFILEEARDVTVLLDNYSPQDGQVTIYKDSGKGCDPKTLEAIGFDGSSSEKRIVPAGYQPSGDYFVYIFSGSDISSEDPYSLFIRTQ